MADRRTSPLALASLVSSLVVVLWPLSSIAAIVLGIMAMSRIQRSDELKGDGLAITGIVIGGVVVFLAVLALAVVVVFGVGCRHGC